MNDVKEIIRKYADFTQIQTSKINFICDILECFRGDFILLTPKECKKFKCYLTNIYNNVSLIQDIMYTCRDEIIDLLSRDNISCIEYLKLSDIKINLNILAENKCQHILEIISKCISKII